MKQLCNKYFLSALAGVLYPFAFAPFNQSYLAIVSIVLLLISISETDNAKQAFKHGFVFGLISFAIGVSWVFVSMNTYTDAPILVSVILTTLLIAYCALFYGLKLFAYKKLAIESKPFLNSLSFASIWVLIEALRGWLLTGFPWLFIGYSQIDTPIAKLATIGGIWLVSFCTVLFSKLGFNLIRRQCVKLSMLSLLVIGFSALFMQTISFTNEIGNPLSVALVQPNIAQQDKWQYKNYSKIFNKHLALTKNNLDAQLIIWPEDAIPFYISNNQEFTKLLETDYPPNIITGLPYIDENKDYYNAMVGLGRASGKYLKQHLVPFGEFVPFTELLKPIANSLNIPMSNLKHGTNNDRYIYINDFKIAPAICYEIAFTNLVRQQGIDTDLIVTLSNDAWFGKSIGPHQHLQMARMRAIENSKYVARATNNGISAIIDTNGKIVTSAPQFVEYVARGEVMRNSGRTPYSYLGNGVLVIFGLMLSLLFIFKITRTNMTTTSSTRV